MAKSSVHAPKESPLSGSSHIERKRDPLSRLTKKKSPIKRSPPLPKVSLFIGDRTGTGKRVYAISIRAWEKTYFIAETDFSCIFMHRFVIFLLTSLQARYPRQMIPCPLITSFVNFSSTLSSEPSFTTISSAALR